MSASTHENRASRFSRSLWPLPLCGVLLGLSAPGYGLWPLAWIALIPALAWVRDQDSLKRVFWGGFALGFAYHGLYCLWFFDLHPLSWLGFTEIGSRLVTLGGWLIITIEGGLLAGLLMLAYRRLSAIWARLAVFPLLWIAGFSLFNWTPMALPWAMIEYTQAPLWAMRAVASLIGASGVALLVILHNVLWAEFVRIRLTGIRRKPALLLAPAVLPGLLAAAQYFPPGQSSPWPMSAAVIQANLPIEVIRSSGLNRDTIESAYLQPARGADFPPGTLLVFPEEGIVPGWVPVARPLNNLVMRELQALSSQREIYIAVGVSALKAHGQPYNAIALISPDRETVQFYFKRRLVPFGEFTPYGFGRTLSDMLATVNVHYSAPFIAGSEGNLLTAGRTKLGGLVCFELIDSAPFAGGFAAQYRHSGAQMLFNTSNLGWFHDNPLLEAQFLAIGQIRAAESRLPLIISSNTGPSAMIAADGRILRVSGAEKTMLFQPAFQPAQNSPK